MSDLREYTVTDANGHESTVQLTAADAERLGAKPVDAAEPKTDAEKPAADGKTSTADTKARTVQNKAVR